MPGIYIGSTAGYAGKNSLALALGSAFLKEGKDVALMKPLATMPMRVGEFDADEDIAFLEETLGISQDPKLSAPIPMTRDFRVKALSGGDMGVLAKIKAAYDELSKGKDLTIVRGSSSFLTYGKAFGASGVAVAKELGLKVILVCRYDHKVDYDYILAVKEAMGDQLLGVVLNDVPQHYMDEQQELVEPFLIRHGVKVLGVIPNDPVLSSISVGRLAEQLPGKIIASQRHTDQRVESFLIGTMQVENFLTHFKKRRNCAMITGGDRSDLHLVALEGKASCLVLTGNLYPNDIILTRAEVEGIPVILTRGDTWTVAKQMESLLKQLKFRDPFKVNHCIKLVASTLDTQEIRQQLGF